MVISFGGHYTTRYCSSLILWNILLPLLLAHFFYFCSDYILCIFTFHFCVILAYYFVHIYVQHMVLPDNLWLVILCCLYSLAICVLINNSWVQLYCIQPLELLPTSLIISVQIYWDDLLGWIIVSIFCITLIIYIVAVDSHSSFATPRPV